MLTGDNIRTQEVHGLNEDDRQKILAFLQGAVYCWYITRRDDWFCARALIGGDNIHWEKYPLGILYSRYIDSGCSEDFAFNQAGNNAGKLLKYVLKKDARHFETERGYSWEYRWIIQERSTPE